MEKLDIFPVTNRTLLAREKKEESELCLWKIEDENKIDYEIIINDVFIMSTYNRLSSQLLVRKSIEKVEYKEKLNILIGGLGMGFSVQEACSFPHVSQIDVIEIEPTIIEWNRSYFADYNRHCLDDKRVHLSVDDFYDYVVKTKKKHDIIIMDIDNPPQLLVQESNQRAYLPSFFAQIKGRLKPNGIFSLWSGEKNDDLKAKIEEVFSHCWVEEVKEEYQNREMSYYIYLAN